MNQFYNVCIASPFNNQIIFFNGHDIHFDDRALVHMGRQNIRPFVLKAGDSVNDQTNDNGPNSKLKSLYNEVKAVCMLKYGTKTFLTQHMNSFLVQ